MTNQSSLKCPYTATPSNGSNACMGCILRNKHFVSALKTHGRTSSSLGSSAPHPFKESEYGLTLEVVQYCPHVPNGNSRISIKVFLDDEFEMNLNWIDLVTRDQAYEQNTFPDRYVVISRFPAIESMPVEDRKYYQRIVNDSNVFYPFSA